MNANLMQWLASGERGVSSNTMVQHLTGIKTLRDWRPDHPHDPDDFGRCRLLLEQVPELRAQLADMATCSGVWAKLAENWQALCDLMDSEAPAWRDGHGKAPKTYARMRELIDAGRRADGWTETAPGCWQGPKKQREVKFGSGAMSWQE